jgi:hypothetical protein
MRSMERPSLKELGSPNAQNLEHSLRHYHHYSASSVHWYLS